MTKIVAAITMPVDGHITGARTSRRYCRGMYQPAHRKFEVEDPGAVLADLCAVVPATLVTHGPDGFRASILPMLFDRGDGPHGTLRGHLARGNPQWREIEASIAAG